jgi:hypothetical protein
MPSFVKSYCVTEFEKREHLANEFIVLKQVNTSKMIFSPRLRRCWSLWCSMNGS